MAEPTLLEHLRADPSDSLAQRAADEIERLQTQLRRGAAHAQERIALQAENERLHDTVAIAYDMGYCDHAAGRPKFTSAQVMALSAPVRDAWNSILPGRH